MEYARAAATAMSKKKSALAYANGCFERIVGYSSRARRNRRVGGNTTSYGCDAGSRLLITYRERR